MLVGWVNPETKELDIRYSDDETSDKAGQGKGEGKGDGEGEGEGEGKGKGKGDGAGEGEGSGTGKGEGGGKGGGRGDGSRKGNRDADLTLPDPLDEFDRLQASSVIARPPFVCVRFDGDMTGSWRWLFPVGCWRRRARRATRSIVCQIVAYISLQANPFAV